MYKLAVIGNPIEHSLSPLVFQLFAKQFQLDISYDKILATDLTDFSQKVKGFFANGGLALNITSPFKNDAYQLANSATIRANFCQAANFLRIKDNQIYADTVDGIGLVEDILVNKHFSLKDKKILIIGSGYVLDSLLLDFIVHNPNRIDILARNVERSLQLKERFATNMFDGAVSYDIVLNTTPNSPDNLLFAQVTNLADGALCYDLTYNKGSLFLDQMRGLNHTIYGHNGLGMLVEQAKAAFVTLFTYEPDTQLVLDELASMGYK